jgi:hypothetical protein
VVKRTLGSDGESLFAALKAVKTPSQVSDLRQELLSDRILDRLESLRLARHKEVRYRLSRRVLEVLVEKYRCDVARLARRAVELEFGGFTRTRLRRAKDVAEIVAFRNNLCEKYLTVSEGWDRDVTDLGRRVLELEFAAEAEQPDVAKALSAAKSPKDVLKLRKRLVAGWGQ